MASTQLVKKEDKPCLKIHTLYQVLGTTFDAFDLNELARMRRKCLQYLHPDKNNGNDDAKIQYKRALVDMAYRVLSNADSRARYNALMNKDFQANSLTCLPKYDTAALTNFENKIAAVVMNTGFVGNNAARVMQQRRDNAMVALAAMVFISSFSKHPAG
jgi:DnaJ-class molecular chaperone